MRLFALCLIAAGLFIFIATPAFGGAEKWNTVGLRTGSGDNRNNASFYQHEVYVTYSLPYRRTTENNWTIGTFTGLNIGYLTCEGDAFVGSIGLGIYVLTPGKRGVLSIGIYPTYLDESEFDRDDFGKSFQFTTAVGLNLNIFKSITIGYRWQHMSNAGLSDDNPGINVNMLEIGYRF